MLPKMLRRKLPDKPEQARPELVTEEPTEVMTVTMRKKARSRTQARREYWRTT
jgi:hypothetical protein